ncbi:hypothetical protein E1264_14115 [Actinomadura sp. KC216]|uniref:hypothetical protein n=1 Tax=Actinomadura sp. KC216 TaxID=2530370 RepID=UPI0010501D47|nr:hypothetical protein [Actinomadura sp. KC216]TDB87615.1 hypothetical protein E1264_14115 [Actinomadura sp. KC216]
MDTEDGEKSPTADTAGTEAAAADPPPEGGPRSRADDHAEGSGRPGDDVAVDDASRERHEHEREGEAFRSEARPGRREGGKAVYNVFLGQVHQLGSTLGFAEAMSGRQGSAVTGRIAPAVIRDASDGYVVPGDCYDEAYGGLERDHVAVVTGPQGSGKRTGALVMLDGVLDAGRPVYALPPSISLKELAGADYMRGHGYVVLDHIGQDRVRPGLGAATPEPGDQGPTDVDHAWLSIVQKVADAGAYLVVTTVDAPPRGPESVRYVAWARPAIRSVLAVRLGEGRTAADAADAVAERVPADLPMADLVRIAEHIGGGRTPEEAVADVLDEAGRREVRQWFADGPARIRVLEVTVLAFLTGVVERDFETCLRMLEDTLERSWPAPKEDGPPPVFAKLSPPVTSQTGVVIGPTVLPRTKARGGDSEPMSQDRRRRVQQDGLIRVVRVRDGGSARRVPAFRKDEYRAYVLEELADHYPNEFWDAVRDWLNRLIVVEQLQISISAALALLSYSNYEEIEYSYLDPWSKGDRGSMGLAAAVYVLWFMCLDEDLVPVALRTAEHWAGQGTASQRLAAIHAFAGELGVRTPFLGARRLWQLVRQCNALSEPAALAFGELFATLIARDGDARHVVAHLHVQLRDLRSIGRTREKYRLTLLAVLAVLGTRNARTGNPAIVEYLHDHPERLAEVTDLWATAFRHRPTRRAALEALLKGLDAIGRLSGPDAEREARALGDALGDALPAGEHDLLKTDFIAMAEHRRSRPARSVKLTKILLDALDRAIRAL